MSSYGRTFILIAAMTALFGGVGFMLGGEGGMLIALGLAAAMNVFAYWNSDKLALKMHGAREIDRIVAWKRARCRTRSPSSSASPISRASARRDVISDR